LHKQDSMIMPNIFFIPADLFWKHDLKLKTEHPILCGG
jgi:hypothetical protein